MSDIDEYYRLQRKLFGITTEDLIQAEMEAIQTKKYDVKYVNGERYFVGNTPAPCDPLAPQVWCIGYDGCGVIGGIEHRDTCTKKPSEQNPAGYAKKAPLDFDPFEDPYENDPFIERQLKEYKSKRSLGDAYGFNKGPNPCTAKELPECTCGAKHTENPNLHSRWCDK